MLVVPSMPLPGYGVGRERPRPTGPAPTGKPAQARAAGYMDVYCFISVLRFWVLQVRVGMGHWFSRCL